MRFIAGALLCALMSVYAPSEEDVPFTPQLKREYDTLYDGMRVRPDAETRARRIARRALSDKARYMSVSAKTGVPWRVIAIIHEMECGGSFERHLHNGDPLRAKTVHVPAGLPADWPPESWDGAWERSAVDALRHDGFAVWTDWSTAGALYMFEKYNGFGYRQYHVHTPYLWAGTQHYVAGKYTGDGDFDPQAVSEQVGAAVLLKTLRALDRPQQPAAGTADRSIQEARL